MKLSKAELAALSIAAAFLLFFAGWFLRGTAAAGGTYVISGQHAPLTETPSPDKGNFVPDELLDLNTAALEDLEALPGIGTVRARAILDWREAHGPFTYPEELTQVPGIGQSTYEGLAEYVTVKEVDPS